MKKNNSDYLAAYPLAAELVAASRMEKQAKIFTDAVYRACVACYRKVVSSGAKLNTDASDGKDVGIATAAGTELSKSGVKRVRRWLKQRYGSRWSNLSRTQQTATIEAAVRHVVSVEPVSVGNKLLIDGLIEYGEYGAIPAHIIASVQQSVSGNMAKSIFMSEGESPATSLAQIAQNAADIKKQIENADFGLTREHWQNHYQNYTAETPAKKPLIDLVKGSPASAETAGAVAPEVAELAQPVIELAAISHAPVMESLTTDVMNNTLEDFRLIVKGGAGKRLAPGVKLDEENLEDLISVDAYGNDAKLAADTDEWVEKFIGRVKDMNAEALKRGIKVTQQAIKEGHHRDWLEEQLVKQMEMTTRKARIIARTAAGNANWNASYYGARAGGMRLYRWRGMLDERERHEHVKREGQSFDPQHPPTDGNPGQPFCCRCIPEWIFGEKEEEEAENEIATRNAH